MTSCRAAFEPARPKWPAAPDGFFMHVGAFLQVTGTGKAPDSVSSPSQRITEARERATVDAWDRLREYLYSIPLAGYGYVRVRAKEEPAFAQALDRFVYAAEVVDSRRDGEYAAVVIRVPKSGINEVLETDFR